MSNSSVKFFPLPILFFLAACQVQQDTVTPDEGSPSAGVVDIRVLPDAEPVAAPASVVRPRVIADILYAALRALKEDRLLTPVDNNAHARFKRVLGYEPDNEIALQGLQDIVKRYLQLSEGYMRRGLFDEARTMLKRASFVDAVHPDIAAVTQALQKEMNSDDLFFELDYPRYAARSEQARNQLVDIAKQAREHEAFFLITAPNDEMARWMVSVMREAVSGYRLRGNIELASRASIRLRLPTPD